MKNEGLKTTAEVDTFLKPFGKKGVNLRSYFAGGDQYYHFFHDFKCQHCGKTICALLEIYLTERGVEWDLVYTAAGEKGVEAIHKEIEQRQIHLAQYEAEQRLKQGQTLKRN